MSAMRNPVSELNGESAADQDSVSTALAPQSAVRRKIVKSAGAASLMSLVPAAVRQGAWAQGSDAPEKKEVRIGFIPLTDAPVW